MQIELANERTGFEQWQTGQIRTRNQECTKHGVRNKKVFASIFVGLEFLVVTLRYSQFPGSER